MFSVHRAKLAHEAAAHKMPVVYPFLLPVTDSGGLIAYAANASDLHRHAAMYVDRILKGAKVGDLPVQQPTTFELVVNMKTGKELGLSIPTNLIARTTDLVE